MKTVFTDQTASSAKKQWAVLGGAVIVAILYFAFTQGSTDSQYSLTKAQAKQAKPMSFSQCFKQKLESELGDFAVNGASLLFEEKKLDKNSIVFVIGGRGGHLVEALLSEYECSVFIFEGIPATFAALSEKFAGNSKVHVFNYYLGSTDSTMALGHPAADEGSEPEPSDESESGLGAGGADAGHKHEHEEESTTVEIRDLAKVIKDLSIRQVHMLHIDCGGCEYDLVEYTLEKSNRIQEIQVSFSRSNVDSPLVRYCRIQEELSSLFALEFRYPFVFEAWRRK
eukprot:c11256_g1_i1.p1 GENE.c11256_g1_i1~~c11256_g1_i1.p1  ORF type:complete len:307 (+),score=59.94 c11256_g1_i1:75-923(+)